MSRSKWKCFAIIFAVIVFCIVIIILIFFTNIGKTDLYKQYVDYRDDIGEFTYHSMNHKPTKAEIQDGKKMSAQFEKCISTEGNEQQVKMQVPNEVWGHYYKYDIVNHKTGKITCRVNFLNLKSTRNTKILWCEVTREINTDVGFGGQSDTLTMVKYKKNHHTNQWEISKIHEVV